MWFNVSRNVCMCFFCSYRGGRGRATAQGRGARGVRDVQGSWMHNEYLSSAHSIIGSLRSLWNGGRVSGKGKKERRILLLLSAAPFPCFPLSSILKWLDFFPPIDCCLLIMFVSSQCAFGVAVQYWPESEGGVSVRGEEDWPVGGADGARGRS